MSKGKAIVMGLNSGITLITEVLHESDTSYILKSPFELVTETTDNGIQTVYFVRYLPYSEDGTILIHKTSVSALSLCADRFQAMYARKVDAFERANQSLTDPDVTAIMEGDVSEEDTNESDDDGDDYDPSEASPVRGPRTYH